MAVITFFIQSITRISTRMFADLTARYENLGLGGMIDLFTKDEIAEIFDIVSIKKARFSIQNLSSLPCFWKLGISHS